MVYRRGELSKAMKDRDWPHQVALPAYRCLGHNYLTMRFFCLGEGLSLGAYRHKDIDTTVFCLPSANMPSSSVIASAVSSWTPPRGRGGRERTRGTPTSSQRSASGTDAVSIAMTDFVAHGAAGREVGRHDRRSHGLPAPGRHRL
jgi:hypothetical protein